MTLVAGSSSAARSTRSISSRRSMLSALSLLGRFNVTIPTLPSVSYRTCDSVMRPSLGLAGNDQGIHDDAAVWPGLDRIEVDLLDPVAVGGCEIRQRVKTVRKRCDVGRRAAAERAEEGGAARLGNHRFGVSLAQRHRPQRKVAQDLDRDAADAECNGQTEIAIAGNA